MCAQTHAVHSDVVVLLYHDVHNVSIITTVLCLSETLALASELIRAAQQNTSNTVFSQADVDAWSRK